MLTGTSALQSTNWEQYPGNENTPALLLSILEQDKGRCGDALSRLDDGLRLQLGPRALAAGPIALVLVGFLGDERMDRFPGLRLGVLNLLVSVVEKLRIHQCDDWEKIREDAAFDPAPFIHDDSPFIADARASRSCWARCILACAQVAPHLFPAMESHLDHGSPAIRISASAGAALLTLHPELTPTREETVARILDLIRVHHDLYEASSHLANLCKIQAVPQEFLHHPAVAMRITAALSRQFNDDERATEILISALERFSSYVDNWDVFAPAVSRRAIIRELLKRAHDFDRLIDATLAVCEASFADHLNDWHFFLPIAFPQGLPEALGDSQRQFLQTLVNQDLVWHDNNVAQKWMTEVALPYDREACRRACAS